MPRARKSNKSHRLPYVEPEDLKPRLKEIEDLIAAILAMQFSDKLKKPLLRRAIWLVTETSGNFRCRYRSDGVLKEIGVPIQRDHIVPKSQLISEALAGRMTPGEVVKNAQCCLVTKEEHVRLHDQGKEPAGLKRYRKARVTVRDMLTYVP